MLTVLLRDQFNRRIIFQCPECGAKNELAGGPLTAVSDGIEVNTYCPQDHPIEVTLEALGGYLWDRAPLRPNP